MILDIIQWPDARLTEIADEAVPGPETAALLDDMAETLLARNGLGLAAPQVGRNVRVICIRGDGGIMGLLNPRIVKRGGIRVNDYEGCLSVERGQTTVRIRRAGTIEVEAQRADGQTLRFKATNLQARIIQHEVDHLNGVVIGYATPPRKKRPLSLHTETS